MEYSAPTLQNLVVAAFLIAATLFELVSGRASRDKKTVMDWKMSGLCIGAMVLIQRPLVYLAAFGGMAFMLPEYVGLLSEFESANLLLCIIAFLLVEDLLNGFGHWICHTGPFQNTLLRRVQAFYKVAHRPHHFSGDDKSLGQVTATQTFVEGWAYWFIMPNYWFQYIWLYFGMYESFIIGLIIKGVWSVHNHVNWHYDLYFLNHPKPWVRKTMHALCHVLIFPTQHHHHHARGRNSATNLHNLFAFYDWLLWKTLVIETSVPQKYGWRQSPREAKSAFKRFFNFDYKRYLAAPAKETK